MGISTENTLVTLSDGGFTARVRPCAMGLIELSKFPNSAFICISVVPDQSIVVASLEVMR